MLKLGRKLARVAAGVVALTAAAGLFFSLIVAANAEDAAGAAKASAVGTGGGWNADVNAAGSVAGVTLDEAGSKAVDQINAYFNELVSLQGTFKQTDAQSQQAHGKFYISRPGKFRFAYGAPSKLVVLSDGINLSYEDHDLQNVDRYPLESTPFKILVQPKVDILRDSQVTDLYNGPDLLTVTLHDKAEDSSGLIKLFFARTGEKLQLTEWVITGPDGNDTRVELAEIANGKPLDPKLFETTMIGMPSALAPKNN